MSHTIRGRQLRAAARTGGRMQAQPLTFGSDLAFRRTGQHDKIPQKLAYAVQEEYRDPG